MLFSEQPKIDGGYPQYTNCIVTLYWADGVPRTPPIMFTSDPKFRKWDSETPIRLEKRLHRERLMDLFGVTPNQVVFMDTTRHYIAESPALLQECGARWKVRDGSLIFFRLWEQFFRK